MYDSKNLIYPWSCACMGFYLPNSQKHFPEQYVLLDEYSHPLLFAQLSIFQNSLLPANITSIKTMAAFLGSSGEEEGNFQLV